VGSGRISAIGLTGQICAIWQSPIRCRKRQLNKLEVGVLRVFNVLAPTGDRQPESASPIKFSIGLDNHSRIGLVQIWVLSCHVHFGDAGGTPAKKSNVSELGLQSQFGKYLLYFHIISSKELPGKEKKILNF
jgi:hypothetical protein